jgi:RHS repeat-associated protein
MLQLTTVVQASVPEIFRGRRKTVFLVKLTRHEQVGAAENSTRPALRYAGMFYEPNSGLYLTEYRAYDPRTGRWLSRDPIGDDRGRNLYAYVDGQPTKFVDPNGAAPVIGLPGVAYGAVSGAVGGAITGYGEGRGWRGAVCGAVAGAVIGGVLGLFGLSEETGLVTRALWGLGSGGLASIAGQVAGNAVTGGSEPIHWGAVLGSALGTAAGPLAENIARSAFNPQEVGVAVLVASKVAAYIYNGVLAGASELTGKELFKTPEAAPTGVPWATP